MLHLDVTPECNPFKYFLKADGYMFQYAFGRVHKSKQQFLIDCNLDSRASKWTTEFTTIKSMQTNSQFSGHANSL